MPDNRTGQLKCLLTRQQECDANVRKKKQKSSETPCQGEGFLV